MVGVDLAGVDFKRVDLVGTTRVCLSPLNLACTDPLRPLHGRVVKPRGGEGLADLALN